MKMEAYSGARAYIITYINKPYIDNEELINDAANFYSNNYDEYMELYNKLSDDFAKFLK